MDFEYYNELLINGQYDSEEERAILEYLREEAYYKEEIEALYDALQD